MFRRKEREVKYMDIQNLVDLLQNKPIVVPVKSSNIATFSYNPLNKILTVLFNRGVTYRYENVEVNTVLNLLKAKSIGTEFNRCVAKNYKYTRLEDNYILNV